MVEGGEARQSFTPYTSFPADDRTKIEIVDAYLDSIRKWQRCLEDPLSQPRLKTAVISLLGWYVWVHGFGKKNENLEIVSLRNKMLKLDYESPELGISSDKTSKTVISMSELTGFMLSASEYMYELKITDILRRQSKPEDFLVQGMAKR